MEEKTQSTDQLHLMKTKRFFPYFCVQFLGAFNDNLIKTVLSIFIAYGIWDSMGHDAGVLVALAAGLFILPFAFFTPFAGNLGDKFDKAALIKWVKLAEIFIILAAILIMYTGNIYGGLLIILLLGIQSAFFAPSKFSILPQHLKPEELIAGNAYVTSGTYISILLGSIVAALIATHDYAIEITAALGLSAALAGYYFARQIPPATPPDPHLNLSYNFLSGIRATVSHALQQKPEVRISILAVSFFYFVAATLHTQFPNFTKTTLGADNIVLMVFMTIFSVGIAVGGFLNHALLKAKANAKWAPLSCLFMGIFGLDFYWASLGYNNNGTELITLTKFLTNPVGLRLITDIFLQAIACGLFVIPLRAIVQERSEERIRSRVIAGSNMLDAFFILASAALSTTLLSIGLTIPELYLTISVLTVIVALALMQSTALKRTHQ